jgi:hypothetical protein
MAMSLKSCWHKTCRTGNMASMKTRCALVVLIFILATSTGCLWLAVGAAGAAGYAIGKDERSAGRFARDADITTRVKTRFFADEPIKAFDINVDPYDGAVTLNGHVETKALEQRAVKIA